MAEVVAIGFYGAEGDAAEAVDFENEFFLLVLVELFLRGLLVRGGGL